MTSQAPDPGVPQDDIALRLMRAVAAQRARVGSDLNQAPVQPEFDAATKSYVFDTAPITPKRLFGSPLAEKGGYARGPDSERLVTSGWGDPLPIEIAGTGGTSTYNQALEYASTVGEQVFAAADGIVRFVGVQTTGGAALVPGVHADEAKQQVLDANGNVIASAAAGNVGFGGIYVAIQHNGDFQGYQTEYYRLSTVEVVNGKNITQGQVIGTVGGAGGPKGWTKPSLGPQSTTGIVLRFQAAIASGGLRALVNPTALVPNYWPGHADSTTADVATTVIMPTSGSVGSQVAAGQAANTVVGLNRAAALENKGLAETKADQSAHADRTAQAIAVQNSALQAATNGFQGTGPQVQNPMTFDFSKGLWSDGKPT